MTPEMIRVWLITPDSASEITMPRGALTIEELFLRLESLEAGIPEGYDLHHFPANTIVSVISPCYRFICESRILSRIVKETVLLENGDVLRVREQEITDAQEEGSHAPIAA